MRLSWIALSVFAAISLISCNRDQRADRDEPAARQAGRDAYRASEEMKRDAKRAAHEVDNAGKEFRQGWNEAKRQDQTDRRRDDRTRH